VSTLGNAELGFLDRLVHEMSGNELGEARRYIVDARLAGLCEQRGFRSVAQLVEALQSRPKNGLHTAVVEALLNNETLFFRDFSPFEVLAGEILPEIIRRRASERVLRIWSAACSSGQEPYSLAMLIRERFPELREWRVEILASDLSASRLARAERAEYTQLEVNRGLPVALLVKYFFQAGQTWTLSPGIRSMVSYRQINLAAALPTLPAMDVVLMRNVLIYFSSGLRHTVLSRVRSILLPTRGVLLLGGAETGLGAQLGFTQVIADGCSYYRVLEQP
jgi:chemotaxis protein methyltransferase CheR